MAKRTRTVAIGSASREALEAYKTADGLSPSTAYAASVAIKYFTGERHRLSEALASGEIPPGTSTHTAVKDALEPWFSGNESSIRVWVDDHALLSGYLPGRGVSLKDKMNAAICWLVEGRAFLIGFLESLPPDEKAAIFALMSECEAEKRK